MIDAATGEKRTFGEISSHAEGLSGSFSEASQCLVAFCLPNSFEWMNVFLALQAIEAGAMPLDASVPADTRRNLARILGASFYWDGHKLQALRARKKKAPRVACVKITSGSQGAATALPCEAGHLLADGRNVITSMGLRPADRNLGLIPFGYSYGLGNLVMPLILQGNPIVFASAFLPSQVPPWIAQFRVTVFPSVPAIFNILAQLPGKTRLSPLRTTISAGSILTPEVARKFYERFGVKLHNFYGASETGGICYDRTGAASLSGRSVGSPLKNVRVCIADDGLVEVRSKAVIFPEGKFVLRDLGEWAARKELRLISRAQSIANIGGRKVHPAEIESTLRDLPGIREARVVVRDGHRDALVAVVESHLGSAEIEKHLHKHLPNWKIPRRLVVRSELPRNERGKLDIAGILKSAGA